MKSPARRFAFAAFLAACWAAHDTPYAFAGQSPNRNVVSRFVGTPLVAAQQAFQRGDFTTALAKALEADAVVQSPYERFHVSHTLALSYSRLGDDAAAIAEFDRALDTGMAPAETAAQIATEREAAWQRLRNRPGTNP